MAVENFVEIFLVDPGVPDFLGVDDHDRTLFAAVKTAGSVDSAVSLSMYLHLLGALLEVIARMPGVVVLAAGFAILPLVGADEDMVLVEGHG